MDAVERVAPIYFAGSASTPREFFLPPTFVPPHSFGGQARAAFGREQPLDHSGLVLGNIDQSC